MTNAYTGAVDLAWGEHRLTLQLGWNVIAKLRYIHGKDWLKIYNTACADSDVEVIAGIVAPMVVRYVHIGGQQDSIEATALMDLSPPLLSLMTAVNEAILYAQHGPEWQAEIAKIRESADPLASQTTRLQRLLATLSHRASNPANSGGSRPG